MIENAISAGLTAGMPIGASGSRTAVNDSMRDTHAILNVIQSSHSFLDNLLEKGTGSDN